jgi:hypothetical protein
VVLLTTLRLYDSGRVVAQARWRGGPLDGDLNASHSLPGRCRGVAAIPGVVVLTRRRAGLRNGGRGQPGCAGSDARGVVGGWFTGWYLFALDQRIRQALVRGGRVLVASVRCSSRWPVGQRQDDSSPEH